MPEKSSASTASIARRISAMIRPARNELFILSRLYPGGISTAKGLDDVRLRPVDGTQIGSRPLISHISKAAMHCHAPQVPQSGLKMSGCQVSDRQARLMAAGELAANWGRSASKGAQKFRRFHKARCDPASRAARPGSARSIRENLRRSHGDRGRQSSESLRREFFQPSDTHTICPWKGKAHYFTLLVDGKENVDAAWYYPEPKPAAQKIAGKVAFWRGVRIEA
jgi:hypothetical protein